MRFTRNHLLLATLMLLLPLAACAPPEEEIQTAETALDDAQAAGAQTYAPETWNEAQQTLEAAKTEIEVQQAKNFITRSYQDARELLAQAEEQASAAVNAAAEEKARVREEARSAIDMARQSLTDVRDQLDELAECPRQPKGFTKDLELLAGQTDGIEAELASAQQAFDEEDFYGASEVAAAVQDQIDALSAELTNAKETIGC